MGQNFPQPQPQPGSNVRTSSLLLCPHKDNYSSPKPTLNIPPQTPQMVIQQDKIRNYLPQNKTASTFCNFCNQLFKLTILCLHPLKDCGMSTKVWILHGRICWNSVIRCPLKNGYMAAHGMASYSRKDRLPHPSIESSLKGHAKNKS